MITVEVVEYERGWGSKVMYEKQFRTTERAEKFMHSINKHNTAPSAPDYYIIARLKDEYPW